ncbi:hypothetical protein KQX54_000563 [Cotesia glomerata]|uniref:Uncharacterized protein n=1 Tax=Cotesia glomerata TaxID=32391 RepID=A0AAV7ISP4_COTGL|nr:hypothetical protein KQX54_000563 [Cotesia glomerata]
MKEKRKSEVARVEYWNALPEAISVRCPPLVLQPGNAAFSLALWLFGSRTRLESTHPWLCSLTTQLSKVGIVVIRYLTPLSVKCTCRGFRGFGVALTPFFKYRTLVKSFWDSLVLSFKSSALGTWYSLGLIESPIMARAELSLIFGSRFALESSVLYGFVCSDCSGSRSSVALGNSSTLRMPHKLYRETLMADFILSSYSE